MNWIIFFVYLLLFCWLITIIPFFKRSGLSKTILCCLFIIKIAAGIAYFQFYSLPANKSNSDSWKFYNRSIAETDLLLKDPAAFGEGFFTSRYETRGGLFSDKQSYWNDVKDEAMVKLMAITNVFTGKNYYANIIWFNLIFFFGLLAFYRVLKSPVQRNSWLLIISIFLLPSFLFWCSGIHKDGLIFSALGLTFYSVDRVLGDKIQLKYLVTIFVSLVVIFFLRNYLVLVLLPCLFIGYMIHLFPRKKLVILFGALFLGCIAVFGGKYIHPSLDVPAYIADKQLQFRKLAGNSLVEYEPLEPGMKSFVAALPAAIDMGFLRPHLNEKGISSRMAALEIIIFWMAFFFCLVKTRQVKWSPLMWSCILFGLITLLIIGFTVPFSGAVVRYRALVLPLILAPVIAGYASQQIKKKYM